LAGALISGALIATGAPLPDPSDAEKDFYRAVKDRFTANPELGRPDPADATDRRIDVSEFLGSEGTDVSVATKNCPRGGPVDSVEIRASFRLVAWDPKATGDASGKLGQEDIKREISGRRKKITYLFYVMFDREKLKDAEDDQVGKWDNARLFYHEMMHGQLTFNRIKAPDWSGWEFACKCQIPNPLFVGDGVSGSDEEHKLIEPAEDKFLVTALREKEGLTVEVFDATSVAGDKDAEGNRPFRKEITIPDELLEKETLNFSLRPGGGIQDVSGNIDRDRGVLVVEGKLSDDEKGDVLVTLDPPARIAVFHLRVLPPPPPIVLGGQPGRSVVIAILARFWWLYLVLLAAAIGLLVRERSRRGRAG
jgi:hypothetical protein